MSELLFFKKKSKSDELLDSCCPKLSYKYRLLGFIGLSIVGWVISSIAIGIFLSRDPNIPKFAILYTIGNIVCIFATCFLSGPASQIKAMKKPERIITTAVYLLSMVGTLVFALAVKQDLVCILFVLIQFLAYIWYTLSFIPFGQKIAKKLCCSCLEGDSKA